LETETLRCLRLSRPSRMLSMACGPSQEVQRFLSETALSDKARFTLLDFNQETLQYARSSIDAIKSQHARHTSIEYVRKSVQQVLKESSRTSQSMDKQFDFVYCAGLFDYLSEPVCQRLMNLMYEWIAPGGLLVATNVESTNPLRHGMEHLLDWHLIYRTAADMRRLIPTQALPEEARVLSDSTGVNLFLEVRKPANV
ncbi:MAG TPA: class I SAM-dependent methyltransferase, partial [Clostridia bacterium]|nr:class I SAM-dependent methyltransferase [Clostridia bacterium]